MHPIQDLFLESFSYELQFDMQFLYALLFVQNFYSCKKWVLHDSAGDDGSDGGSGDGDVSASPPIKHHRFLGTYWW
jgi:hypothetical protein